MTDGVPGASAKTLGTRDGAPGASAKAPGMNPGARKTTAGALGTAYLSEKMDSGPNGLKLSDRQGGSKRGTWNQPCPPCLFAGARG